MSENKIYDVECEQVILGVLLVSPNYQKKIFNSVDKEWFYEPVHTQIYEWINDRYKNNSLVKYHVLNREFDILFNSIIKNPDYGTTLLNAAAGCVDVEDYVKELRDLYVKREIKKVVEGKDRNNINKVFERLTTLNELSKKATVNTLFDAEGGVNRRIADLKIPDKSDRFIKTGIFEFDEKFGGLSKGQLSILAANASAGKSTAGLQFALNCAKAGKKVLFFSLEMGESEIMNKILANLCNINSFKLTTGNLHTAELQDIEELGKQDWLRRITFDYTTNINQVVIDNQIKNFKRKCGSPDLVIIDHLHIMRDARTHYNRNEELGNITMDLKNIVKESEFAMLLLAQLSRKDKKLVAENINNNRPELTDLRESGNIEQNGDLITFLFRPDYYTEKAMQGLTGYELERAKAVYEQTKNMLWFLTKKNRNGSTGDAKTNCYLEYSRVCDN
jgi:replicative DNA helicase